MKPLNNIDMSRVFVCPIFVCPIFQEPEMMQELSKGLSTYYGSHCALEGG